VGNAAGGDGLTVYWAPGGKRTVWVVHHSGTSMRDPGWDDVVVGTTGAPTVEVVASDEDAAIRAAQPLCEAGFGVVATGKAKKARDATVVYATRDATETAKQVAAKLPGATVAPLTWPSAYDVVVALGRGG